VLLVVLGALGILIGLALLAGGGVLTWALATQRDSDGFFKTSTERLSSPTYAISKQGLDVDLGEEGDPLFKPGRLGTIRIRATSANGKPVFIGIGPEDAVDSYLSGAAHDEIVDIDVDPFRPTYRRERGGRPPTPPGRQSIWVISARGPGRQEVTWKVADGSWAAVLMNATATRGVAADVSIGAKSDLVLPAAIVLLVLGVLFTGGGVGLVVLGLRHRPVAAAVVPAGAVPPGAPEVVPPAPGEAAAETAVSPVEAGPKPYPIGVEARLDADLSRWLWVVKWLLAIPHYVVLVLLSIGFFLLTVVAFFAILVTGRYPRSIFAFNVGVLRWAWRVSFYAFALGTDRYPPFTLDAAPDYPATLDIPYPERLSRGLVLVKWWLLALPHLIVLAFFFGELGWSWGEHGWVQLPSLAAVLGIIAGGHLLFTGRYPRDLFELILGLYRWGFRVGGYVSLMRDEYPPFRLSR
jgi:hypothetical protein